jgi:hypothetical protein
MSLPANQWSMGLGGFGEMLLIMKIEFTSIIPKDKWGQPVLGIDCEYKENEAKMREDMMWDAAEMLASVLKCKNV